MIDYNGKTALVTGAASGIGAALAKALAARGAQVLCADVNAEGVAGTVQDIGGNAVAITCDLANPAGAGQLLEDAWKTAGKLDLVCSNAGIGYRGTLNQSACMAMSPRPGPRSPGRAPARSIRTTAKSVLRT